MGFLSGLIGVVFLVYMLLRISRMLGGPRSTVVITNPAAPPQLWGKSAAEIQSSLDNMPTKWVAYEGMTPPLQLKIRGLTGDLYQTFVHFHVDAYGRQQLESMSPQDRAETLQKLRPAINAEAYVVDWNGAQYPNGNPLRFSPDNLAAFMRKDEMLVNFISEEAGNLANTNGLAWD